MKDFRSAKNTFILSDIHLSEPEKGARKGPLWKRYKRRKFFIDHSFKSLVDYILQTVQEEETEMILNGDIFDFDSVLARPKILRMSTSWLERARGLNAEQEKSVFKIRVILNSHPIWVKSLRKFVMNNNRLIFVIGNHDVELHWPQVQLEIIKALDLPETLRNNVRFCEWFYISNGDTLVEHGNQYDSYCLCMDPIHPLIKKGKQIVVRLPFGNVAGRFMINGIGLMNPHATNTYIKKDLWEYLVFYYRYMMRVQPFVFWTWLWSSFATLVFSLVEALHPAIRDPISTNDRIQSIATKSNANLLTVVLLKEVHVHPAIFNPIKILKELWLDRALLILGIVFLSFQIFSLMHVFARVSFWWFIAPNLLLFPVFFFYARSVQSGVEAAERAAFELAPLSARISKVSRIVQGHTHLEMHTEFEGIEILNTGTWSPAFHDVECTKRFGRKCVAWLRPLEGTAGKRGAFLYEWKDEGELAAIPFKNVISAT